MAGTRQARGGVLIAGGGFGGGYVARLLGRAGATIVSPENSMLYTPMLPEAASGTPASSRGAGSRSTSGRRSSR